MPDIVREIQVFLVDLAQPTPYLGPLRESESVNSKGYFVRKGNRTVYPEKNRSLVVRARTGDGVTGWGETYGLVAPLATAEIIDDLLAPFVIGRVPSEVETIHDELADLMRVRGYLGGYYSDALAAIDIALWDIYGKQQSQSLGELLHRCPPKPIPAYVSGLPKKTLQERCELAVEWQSKGFDAVKFAAPVADDGPVAELEALRKALGPNQKIACDLHWAFSAEQALFTDRLMANACPWFLEAPVAPEDITGLTQVAHHANAPIAAGEEWSTIHDAQQRIDAGACQIIQPEMGHTGITQFMRIAQHAEKHKLELMPHATIGSGIFLAASLQVSSGFPGTRYHEYQHSIFDSFKTFTKGNMDCVSGFYEPPGGPGLGAEPTEEMIQRMTRVR